MAVNRCTKPFRHQLLHRHGLVIPLLGNLLDALGELKVILQDAAEVGFVEDEKIADGFCSDVGRARFGEDQGDFAEAVAIAERGEHFAAAVEHLDLAAADEIHFVPRLAFANDDLAR